MRLWNECVEFMKDDSGLGTILVVLIGLVLIFKKQMRSLLESIFKQINSSAKEVY